jgi:hypothetical protein
VQVAHERLEDLAQAGIGRAVEAGLDGSGQVGVGEVAPLGCLRGWLLGHPSTIARAAQPVKCHCTVYAMSGSTQPPGASSSSRASASSARSWPRRPMSWTPTGSPAVVRATGTATAGRPSALA